jgi:membrane protein YqaA with SNARE-associated domain
MARYAPLVIFLVLTLVFLTFGKFRHEIKAWAKYSVNQYGYPAIFVLTWLSDVLIQPIPADVIVFGSTFGGAHIVRTAVVAGVASTLGGLTGYFIGTWFGPKRFRRIFGIHMLRNGRDLFRNYGALAIFVSGITPIPYSAVCWVGGIYRVPIGKVLLASFFSRSLRYLFFGWLGYMF